MARFNLADHIQAAQTPQVRDIETITEEIITAKLQIGENLFVIGRGLIEAKAQLPHGEWLSWLTRRVEFSEATAQNYMKLVRKYSNPEALRDLGYTKALMLLALPDGTREEYIETTHIVDGEEKTVAEMSSRELKAALKERDEALKAAEQAKAEQTAAEQAREKMAADIKWANERIMELNDAEEAWRADEQKWQQEIARLEKELEDLRARPVEVAVQADEAAVQAARKEAEAAMRDKLDKARAAEKKARDEAVSAANDVSRAERELKQAQAELDALRARMAQAEKKSAISADADMVLFSELYEQAQILVKRMGGVRLKKRDKDPEKAEKLQTALMALIPVVKEAAGRE